MDQEQDQGETIVAKRLPRSAKKKLKYEKLRQQWKLHRKKKKKTSTSNKMDKRQANQRLQTVNEEENRATICIDCSYNQSMSPKVRSARRFFFVILFGSIGDFQCRTTNWTLLQFESSCNGSRPTCSFQLVE